MAGLVNVARVAETIQAYQLTSAADMMAALEYILGSPNYVGTITANRAGGAGGALTWQLIVNDIVQNTSSYGYVNDWVIIENNATASICPASKFASFYTVT